MSNERARQKKLAKQKKKRAVAKARASAISGPSRDISLRDTIKMALGLPFGPCLVGYEANDEVIPGLVTVLLTRVLPDGDVIPFTAMLDRTCLGVKNGFVSPPKGKYEMEELVDQLTRVHERVEPCSLLFAQSMIFHAIDYARTLGFEPQRDFPVELLGPRPATLLETPLAHPSEPIYVSGPRDDVGRVMKTLAAHGHPSPKMFLGGPAGELWADELEEGDDEEDADEGGDASE